MAKQMIMVGVLCLCLATAAWAELSKTSKPVLQRLLSGSKLEVQGLRLEFVDGSFINLLNPEEKQIAGKGFVGGTPVGKDAGYQATQAWYPVDRIAAIKSID